MVVSGIRVLSYVHYTRRDRFILAAAMSFGFGNLLVPDTFTFLFQGVKNPKPGLQGLFNSITIILSTPCKQQVLRPQIFWKFTCFRAIVLSAGLVAVVLNLILPQEALSPEDEYGSDVEQGVGLEADNDNDEHKA